MDEPGRRTGRLRSIGPYTLLDRVGSGGMGVVYRALDRRSGTAVAFKLLHEHVAADPAAVERFRREAHVASLLRSSYTVRTLDFGNEDGHYFLVSEFVEGRSLADILSEGQPEPLAALAIASQVALALDEADARQIAHRDIKPENILVCEDGSVKLADFGIASLRYLGGLTRSGSFVGTVAYAAPEQTRGTADIRSDIYALGVVLFEMLAGERPFRAESAPELMRLHDEAAVPFGLLATQSPKVVEVLRRCLEKRPADRFQHPSELLAAIETARIALPAHGPAEGWMESAVAEIGVTGAYAAAPPSRPESPGAPEDRLLAAAQMAQPGSTPRPRPVTRLEAGGPADPNDAGRSLPRRPILAAVGVVLVVLVASVASAIALGGGDDRDDPAAGSGDDVTPTASATSHASPSVSATASASSSASPSPRPSGVATFGTSPGPGTQPAVPIDPTATPRPPTTSPPTPTSTNVPPTPTRSPTPTPVAPSYSGPVFATNLTASGLPPAAGVPSGGTLGGACPIRNLYAYVTHKDVPLGTQFTGSWTYQGAFQASNPSFASDSVNGATNYNFGNADGLPSGVYGFALRAGGVQVSAGTVTITC